MSTYTEKTRRKKDLSLLVAATDPVSDPVVSTLDYSKDAMHPHTLLVSVLSIFVILELAGAIRANVLAARRTSPSNSVQVFFDSDMVRKRHVIQKHLADTHAGRCPRRIAYEPFRTCSLALYSYRLRPAAPGSRIRRPFSYQQQVHLCRLLRRTNDA